ncbi:hypothetical protein ADUPG1_000172, partial [Aduncisulcus paluster]
SVSALPDTSECADTYTSLSSLNLAETSIIDISALLVAADSTNVSLTELIMNGVSLYDDVAETTSLFDPSILVSFSSISSLGLASLGLVDSDLLSIVHLALDELNVAHNSLVDISPLYHLNGDLATLDISYNSICLDGVDYDDDSALYDFFPKAATAGRFRPPSITSSSQDTSSCGFCSSSETAGDGAGDSVIHCSDTSSAASLSSNTICRKVWDWTESVEEDDGSGGVTTTTIYHEQWSVECNLYSYKVDNGDETSSSCVSYLDESDNYTPPASFPTCVESSMDNANVECYSIDGTETSCIEGWYGDESSCEYECAIIVTADDVSSMCSEVYGYGTCDTSTHVCSCSEGYEGDICEYLAYDSLEDFICANRNVSSIVEVSEGASIECVGNELTPVEVLDIIGLDLSSSGLSDISGLRFGTNLVSLDLSGLPLDASNPASYLLTELSDLPNLQYLDVSGANIDVTNAISNMPTSLRSLYMNSLNLGADTDFSMFTDLSILSVTNNTSFNISSITYLPVSLTHLNISGCSSFSDLGVLLVDDYDENLTTLIVDDVSLTNKQTLGSFSSLSTLSVSNTGLTDDDLFHIVSISSLQTLDLSNNSLTDISLLFQLSELTSLDVSQNKLCGVTDEIFKPFFTLSDSITITTGNESTSTAIDQDDAYCGYCSDSTPSVDPSSNVVCKEVWSGEYHTDCAIFSYRDYSNSGSGSGSEEPLTCVNFGSEVDTSSLTCLSGIESNPNTQCIGVYNESDASVSIESGCVEGWYGDECLDECPLQGTEECGGSGYGTCDSSTHTCDCNLGYEGDACEFLNYD